MARPDPALLDPQAYPFHCDIPTRYADMDTNHHVNNVALAAIVEDARVRFHMATGFAGAMPKGGQVMLVSFSIEYLAQVYYPAPIVAWSGIAEVGTRSMRLRHLLVQEGKPVALAESVAVYVQEGRAAELPESLKGNISQWMCR